MGWLPPPLDAPARPFLPPRPFLSAMALLAIGPLAAAAGEEGGLVPRRTGGVAVETAALIMSGQEGGEIPVEGLAVPLPADGPSAERRTSVLVVVEADGEALLAGHSGGPLAFEVLVYAVREDGALSGTLMQSFEVQLDILGERLRAGGVKFVGDLGLPAGRYTLRAMVRNPATEKVGLRGIPVEVPDGSPAPGPPLVFAAEDAWIVAREAGPGALATLPAPEARPVADGGIWPALAKEPVRAARAEPRETVGAGERALQRRLGEALRTLAAGHDEAAQALLWELASSVLDGAEAGSPEDLDRAESRGFRAVAEARPEGLGPIMMLYDWLYREGLRSNVPAVFTHARTTILKLVNLFLKSSNGGPVRARQAAQMLTSLGGVVQKAGLLEFSEELFLRAVALDSANEATLLALAVNDERVGGYEAAAGHLKELLKLDPAHGQARLRFAVNLARGGKKRAAAEHLERIVEGKGSADHARWIVSLAYQELAKLHLADDRLEAAGDVLRRGTARLPQDEKLHLLLAFLHDAQGEPGEALRVLSRLDLPRPEAEGSPRHRYILWPTEALAATRSSFIDTAEAQRSDLAMALGVGSPEESAP